jgi:Flp pilus assembly protein TadG
VAVSCLALGSVATGLAVAASITTTHPITLCVGKLGGNVTAPGSTGKCTKLQNAIQVASAADVAALASRADAAEGKQAADELDISNLQAANQKLTTRLADDEAALQKLLTGVTGRLTISSEANAFHSDPIDKLWDTPVTGSNLKPGSDIILHSTTDGSPVAVRIGAADAYGNFVSDVTLQMNHAFLCGRDMNAYVTGTDVLGAVTSNTIVTGPNC